jgi:hypothetical protein
MSHRIVGEVDVHDSKEDIIEKEMTFETLEQLKFVFVKGLVAMRLGTIPRPTHRYGTLDVVSIFTVFNLYAFAHISCHKVKGLLSPVLIRSRFGQYSVYQGIIN